jgi:hypothetical protein
LGFGRDINLGPLPLLQRLTYHRFGMARAVKLRRVNEIDPGLKGVQQGAESYR